MFFNLITNFLKDLLFPSYCFNCSKEGKHVCENCFELLKNNICEESSFNFENSDIKNVFTVFKYSDNCFSSQLIHLFKYDFIKELSAPLGELMSIKFKKIIYEHKSSLISPKNTILCPVPLHKKRLKWRGFNQSELLADYISLSCNIDSVNLLKRIHFYAPQMSLDSEQRHKNISGAFVINDKIDFNLYLNKTIFLVDDVGTTLSTINECALTLKKNGFNKIYAILLSQVY